MLKYYKVSVNSSNLSILLPIVTNKQFNTTELLVIDHNCDFFDLSNILYYAPQLHRLNVTRSFYYVSYIENVRPTTWPNLTHFSMHMIDGMFAFEDFEIFISKICFIF
jgi:hypothetical protein